jgi:hypothetical protein
MPSASHLITRSSAMISVAARMACSSSARRTTTCPVDRSNSLGVSENAGEGTHLAQVDAVLVLAHEDVHESRASVVDQLLPLVEPAMSLRAADGPAHPLDVAKSNVAHRSEVADQLREHRFMQLELQPVLGPLVGGVTKNAAG